MKNLFVILTILLITVKLSASTLVKFAEHNIDMAIDPPNHKASFTDKGKLTLNEGTSLFWLNSKAEIISFQIDEKNIEFKTYPITDKSNFPALLNFDISKYTLNDKTMLVAFDYEMTGDAEFAVNYSAELFEDVSQMRFSRERVGGEVNGTILDKGAYLSPSSLYYPQGDEDLLIFTITADIPAGWESVSDGNRLSTETKNDRVVQTWHNPYYSDGLMFMAGPYAVKSVMQDSIEVACYFFPEDTALFDRYLTATAEYIKMYSDLIGPYPFQRFTVAENFFPTGYGMPGWTLLGQQVINLPFIITSSLGHEVLHNWFGNSLYVDYETGNWCESITVYGADYRYKLMQSDVAAKEYRKDILKQYDSYVNEGNDFPIRDFKSRTSPETRTIGYNKAMMFFHYIHELIGDEIFFKTWKDVYAQYIGQKVTWEIWIKMFEKNSGQDLSHLLPEWVDRTGAPKLDAKLIDQTVKGNMRHMMIRIAENSPDSYLLKVPVRFSNDTLHYDTTVTLTKKMDVYTFDQPAHFTSFEVDPEYHLFRKLYSEEVEAIISGVLGVDKFVFMTDEAGEQTLNLFKEFAFNLTDDSVDIINMSQLTGRKYEEALINLNPKFIPVSFAGQFEITDDAYIVKGKSYPKKGHTIILSGQNSDIFDKYLLIISDDFESIPRLGQLIPHYGKYSFLVFEGAKNVDKGQWDVTSSPLKISITASE